MWKSLRSMDLGSVLFGASLAILIFTLFLSFAGKKELSETEFMQMEIDTLESRVDYLEKKQGSSNREVFERILEMMITHSQNNQQSTKETND